MLIIPAVDVRGFVLRQHLGCSKDVGRRDDIGSALRAGIGSSTVAVETVGTTLTRRVTLGTSICLRDPWSFYLHLR